MPAVEVPRFMLELVAELTHLARRSPDISQRSGVSVRVSIANLEVLEATALKRAVRLAEPTAAPRISDLPALVASTAGKIELESIGDEAVEERIVDRLLARAVANVFNRTLHIEDLEPVVQAFESGLVLEVGEGVSSADYVRWAREIDGLGEAIKALGVGRADAATASAVELVLEGLHLHRRLNKDRTPAGARYRD
jgi:magnesium chelatase subunit I